MVSDMYLPASSRRLSDEAQVQLSAKVRPAPGTRAVQSAAEES